MYLAPPILFPALLHRVWITNVSFAYSYLRAFEVGRPPFSPKYELHLRLRTAKSGPVVRNRLRLPHPVRTDLRVCVICPPDSDAGQRALAAGAALVGTEEVFEAVKAGRIEFDRCIAHEDYVKDLQKAGVARVLGPRGMMPNAKDRTVTKDVAGAVRDMVSAAEYRERMGVVRLAVGKLGFTPEQVGENIKAVMGSIKRDMGTLSEQISKEIHEVVLSSTHGPGISLTGEFRSAEGVEPVLLSRPC
jgi:large subunit ribosomal protein L1